MSNFNVNLFDYLTIYLVNYILIMQICKLNKLCIISIIVYFYFVEFTFFNNNYGSFTALNLFKSYRYEYVK